MKLEGCVAIPEHCFTESLAKPEMTIDDGGEMSKDPGLFSEDQVVLSHEEAVKIRY